MTAASSTADVDRRHAGAMRTTRPRRRHAPLLERVTVGAVPCVEFVVPMTADAVPAPRSIEVADHARGVAPTSTSHGGIHGRSSRSARR